MPDEGFRLLRLVGYVTIPMVILTLPLFFQIHMMVIKQGGDDTLGWLGFSAAMLFVAWFLYRWTLVTEPLVVYESAIAPTERPFMDRRGRAITFGEILELRVVPMNRRPGRERFILKDRGGNEYYVDFRAIAQRVKASEHRRARVAFDTIFPAIQKGTGGAVDQPPSGP